jgi:hypothetical protein
LAFGLRKEQQRRRYKGKRTRKGKAERNSFGENFPPFGANLSSRPAALKQKISPQSLSALDSLDQKPDVGTTESVCLSGKQKRVYFPIFLDFARSHIAPLEAHKPHSTG